MSVIHFAPVGAVTKWTIKILVKVGIPSYCIFPSPLLSTSRTICFSISSAFFIAANQDGSMFARRANPLRCTA
jgi:hypothetical protein